MLELIKACLLFWISIPLPQRGAMFIEHDVPKFPRSSGAVCDL